MPVNTKRSRVVPAICFVAWCMLAGMSQGDDLETLVKRIQATYDGIKDFQAQFVQESSIKSWNAQQVQRAEGVVYFKKSGKMFWDYRSPTPQQIISDGRQLWFYEPEDKQVTITTVGEGLQSQVSGDLLNGKANLSRDFTIRDMSPASGGDGGVYVLELIPRESQPNLSRIILRVDRRSFRIQQTEVYDLFDNLTRITFSGIAIDKQLADALFTFTPPPGVDSVAPPDLPLPDKKR